MDIIIAIHKSYFSRFLNHITKQIPNIITIVNLKERLKRQKHIINEF
jgi:hypothetical protein